MGRQAQKTWPRQKYNNKLHCNTKIEHDNKDTITQQ